MRVDYDRNFTICKYKNLAKLFFLTLYNMLNINLHKCSKRKFFNSIKSPRHLYNLSFCPQRTRSEGKKREEHREERSIICAWIPRIDFLRFESTQSKRICAHGLRVYTSIFCYLKVHNRSEYARVRPPCLRIDFLRFESTQSKRICACKGLCVYVSIFCALKVHNRSKYARARPPSSHVHLTLSKISKHKFAKGVKLGRK